MDVDVDGWRVENEQDFISTHIGRVKSAQVTNVRSGNSATFYSFDLADWVNCIAVTDTDELVCIRQFRFGSRRMEFEIPGGAIEQGEDPLVAGVRELLEETGYRGERARIIGEVRPNPAIQSNHCYTILVEGARKVADQSLDEMEDIEVCTYPVSRIEQMVTSGEITHGLVLNALMFYHLHKMTGHENSSL